VQHSRLTPKFAAVPRQRRDGVLGRVWQEGGDEMQQHDPHGGEDLPGIGREVSWVVRLVREGQIR
jgi:hypothetical protein